MRFWIGRHAKNNKVVIARVDVYDNVDFALYTTDIEATDLRDKLTRFLEEEKRRASQGGVDSSSGSSGSNKG